MTASFTLLVLSSKDRGASSPSILYPKEESGSHCLLIFVLKPRSAGLKFGSTILPLFYKHQANEQLITNDMLEQKKKLENLLQTSMEIVENKEPDYIFRHGHYIEKPEDPNIAFGECPF